MFGHLCRSGSLPAFAMAATLGWSATASAAPTVAQALGLKPVQPNVDYQKVDDATGCKLEDIERDDWAGWEVVSPEGETLRRFADTNGDSKVDLWCYYRYGVEVYRDVDSNFNGKADQYRWMGTEGIRWGLDDNEDATVDRWKQISAEEVSAELVAAIRDADAKRFGALLADQRDLTRAGLGAAQAKELAEKASLAARRFARLADSQKTIGKDANWVQFTATAPGVVPAGTQDATRDFIVYENAVAMYESDGKSGQLVIGTMIKVDDGWKLVDLPSMPAAGEAIEQTAGIFFRPVVSTGAGAVSGGVGGAEMQKMVTALEAIDRQLAEEKSAAKLADLHARRADVVEQLIANSPSNADKQMWVRQLVDTVGFAVQSGAYPKGLDRLKQARQRYAGSDESLQSYIDFQVLSTEYAAKLQPGADSVDVQEWYLEQLTAFVKAHPRAAESAQAMLQLALGKEFEDNEKEALDYYRQIASRFKGTDAAQKAAGAIRRLDSVGKAVDLSGKTVAGQPFRLASLRGKPVIVQYWATWCEPCKEDMKQLRRLKAQYRRAGLEVVGISVDSSRQQAESFIKANSMPWIQLFEDGGLDSSPLALQFGVQTLPTMMLIDKRGALVRHNVSRDELEAELKKLVQ
ncbi:Thiol-disulfide oxidoreductase ResA [Crateriforma conspicua]|uniref:Thiol-disulfide oxidoreductase ResA n=2 Tax=Crateriforma conspicua TaxID=2527996 RepID=A0A5C5Y541_9PLAN|nr:Thiol-disulfide oxidoreductase ResA [Crateriforma conspicua]TWT70244.1 Thiol-disulfide oxidoreductase ResA [Crateriforma conspicua]